MGHYFLGMQQMGNLEFNCFIFEYDSYSIWIFNLFCCHDYTYKSLNSFKVHIRIRDTDIHSHNLAFINAGPDPQNLMKTDPDPDKKNHQIDFN